MANRKNRSGEEERIDESWLIPYSDLMTLLLALFIVLFASSTIDAQKYNSMKESLSVAFSTGDKVVDLDPSADTPVEEFIRSKNDQNLEELKRTVDSYIGENNLGKDLQTRLQNNYLVITIPDRALFDSGSAQIKPQFISTITSIGSILEQYPQYEVVVSGHTDNVPINTREFPSNWDLSSERALNIMKLVLQNPNLDPQRFSAIGYGEYRPVDTNDTAAGRTKNRRVEVTIKQRDVKLNNLTE